MTLTRVVGLIVSHAVVGAAGFFAGIYYLPILVAPPAPDADAIAVVAEERDYVATFSRDRADSDNFHWGEGEVSISNDSISFVGELAPGPDYKLYLSPEYVETEADFLRLKADMVQVGDVRTFENFIVEIPDDIDPAQYGSVIVWCESFGEFITSGEYQSSVRQAPADKGP